MARARRACPDGVFLSPRFDLYGEKSAEVMAILRSFTPLVEPIASDEAFLDVSGATRIHGSGRECAVAIRARLRREIGLTASVGVAGTKLLAKLASDLAKPDGLLVAEPGTELDFLHPLPVERLWGVGPATRRRLAGRGIDTVGQLSELDERDLVALVGDAHGRHLHALAWNRDHRPVEPDREVKSIGHEETFPTDRREPASLERTVAALADGVAARLRRAGRVGRTVQLKVRYAGFRTITRSRTIPAPTDLAAEIASVAVALLRDVPDLDVGVRLLGVSVQQLSVPEAVQPDLFGFEGSHTHTAAEAAPEAPVPPTPRMRSLERTIDAVRERFGHDAVDRASSRVEHPEDVRDNGEA
jgi:DNA polymerase-4